MEDPKTSPASSSDTLSLGRNRGPIWDSYLQPQYSPILGATPFPRVQARPQLGLSIDPHLPFPYRLAPKVDQKWGPTAKLVRSGLEIGAFNSSCKGVKSVSFCPTYPGMPDEPRLACITQATQGYTYRVYL